MDQCHTNTAFETGEDIQTKAREEEVKEEEAEYDTRFGYGSFKPRCLQPFNKLWIVVLCIAVVCFVDGIVINGLTNTSIPSIEKQFELTSSKSGLIPASEDIGAVIVLLFITYIGGRYNKIKWIALGAMMMSLGAFLFIIPHLATTYDYKGAATTNQSSQVCVAPGTAVKTEKCPANVGVRWLGVFVVSMIISGIGFSPAIPLGAVYFHDNTEPEKATLCLSLCFGGSALGTAVGFLIGSQIIQNLYVDFDKVNVTSLGLTARDPKWLGAWWVGYLIGTVALFLVAIPLFGFPKYMPNNKRIKESEEAFKNRPRGTFLHLIKEELKGFLKALFRLAKNPVYVFTTLAGCTAALRTFGVLPFVFKYVTEMYHINTVTGGYISAGLVLFGAFGSVIGGAIVKCFKLNVVGMLRLCTACVVFSTVLGLGFLARCPDTKMAGLDANYFNDSKMSGFISDCNLGCDCQGTSFNPVCGDDGLSYYSPCHAGCLSPQRGGNVYRNCSCVALNLNKTTDLDAKVTRGRCGETCSNIRIFIPVFLVMVLLGSMTYSPGSMAFVRSVDDDLRPFSMGVSVILARILGQIPGPIFLGTIIDNTCKLWSNQDCESVGVCQLYNLTSFSKSVMTYWMVLSGVTLLLFFTASIFAGRASSGQSKASYTLDLKGSDKKNEMVYRAGF